MAEHSRARPSPGPGLDWLEKGIKVGPGSTILPAGFVPTTTPSAPTTPAASPTSSSGQAPSK